MSEPMPEPEPELNMEEFLEEELGHELTIRVKDWDKLPEQTKKVAIQLYNMLGSHSDIVVQLLNVLANAYREERKQLSLDIRILCLEGRYTLRYCRYTVIPSLLVIPESMGYKANIKKYTLTLVKK